ncbi:MAG: TipAS antibiotic-recognition domain-containing protein [Clostridia bacterium]|nr:TipAS antibiotic-recognition domain-containing protein [Clostridia bacterium]
MSCEKYKTEAAERFGNTDAYREFSAKTAGASKEELAEITEGLEKILGGFAECKQNQNAPDSAAALELVAKLQAYISANFYNCTDEILAGLGRMYVADERFKNNIDKHGEGTAEFISEAIESKLSNRKI